MSRFSRSCLVGAGALLLTLSRPAELPADTFIRGDSNLDRTIDITDAVSLLGCLYLGQACASCEDASDANDDGSLDLSDAVYTLAFAFLGGVAPRPPHPAPGPDPTADLLTCERGLGPEPVRIEVDPPALELAPLEEVQLQVTAVFSDAATSVVIAGQAPLEVETFRLNGAALTPTRVGIAGWSFTRSIPLGETVFLVEGLDGTGAVVSSDSIRVLRVPPCVPASLEPAQAPAGPSVAIIVHGSGFVPGSSPKVRLTSASGESGFNALYVQAPGSFGGGAEAMDNAVALLNNPASAQ